MKYSKIALNILAAKECGLFKYNTDFWSKYPSEKEFISDINNNQMVSNKLIELEFFIETEDKIDGMICIYDEDFPIINSKVKNKSEKPILLFYKGDISLLKNLNNNVSVIGLTDPDDEIVRREKDVVKRLVDKDLVIVSGLAKGCDTVAHITTLENSGKTIAILPTQIAKIFPSENVQLAEEIVNKGGLLITEYYKESASKMESISRFIERDRLQAMFSKTIILIASYRQNEGDSGSRHAMKYAEKYGLEKYVVYNEKTDNEDPKFGLNKDFVIANSVKILSSSSIEYISKYVNQNLIKNNESINSEQLTLL